MYINKHKTGKTANIMKIGILYRLLQYPVRIELKFQKISIV